MTITDIARLAKCSIATVSRVINEKKVNKETKERVFKIISKYGYRPNTFAQYLGRRKSTSFRLKKCKRLQ